VTDTEGKTHSLAGYKGKWVLVNYWATWCPPCLAEIPDLIELHQNKRNNLVVIGVAVDFRAAKQVTDFAESMKINYPIVLGSSEVISQIAPVQ
jgi:thiol-disulfide isomerase/thioredoxin